MTVERPECHFIDDCYRFEWPKQMVSMELERFHETKDDIRCELTVTSTDPVAPGRLFSGRLLLIGPNSLRDVARSLKERDPEKDWSAVIGQARDLARDRYRSGDPLIDLRQVQTSERPRYLVRPLIYEGNAISMLYGLGETAKSVTALSIGVAVASGEQVFVWDPSDSGPVIYLDWEDDAETHSERLRAIAACAGIDAANVPVFYQQMHTSLPSAAREVRRRISELGARLVIIDSLGVACGGDPQDAEAMITTLIAARSLGVPVLVIHHMSKGEKDKRNPYGSVYGRNEVRLAWHVEGEVERGEEMAVIRNVFTNTKANRGVTQSSMRLATELTLEGDDVVSIEIRELQRSEAVRTGQGRNHEIIADALKYGPLTVSEIAEAVEGMDETVVRTTLNRYSKPTKNRPAWFVNLDNSHNARWANLETESEPKHVSKQVSKANETHPASKAGVSASVSRLLDERDEEERVTCTGCHRTNMSLGGFDPTATTEDPAPLCLACAEDVNGR